MVKMNVFFEAPYILQCLLCSQQELFDNNIFDNYFIVTTLRNQNLLSDNTRFFKGRNFHISMQDNFVSF